MIGLIIALGLILGIIILVYRNYRKKTENHLAPKMLM